jgi:hypothetical protein
VAEILPYLASSLAHCTKNTKNQEIGEEMVSRDEYIEALQQLPGYGHHQTEDWVGIQKEAHITDPTPEYLATLFPHLTTDEIEESLRPRDQWHSHSNHIACPPVRVHDTIHTVRFVPAWTTGFGERRPAQLYHDATLRERDVLRLSGSHPPFHVEKALNFAKAMWGAELVQSDWISSTKIELIDPTDPCDEGRPYPDGKRRFKISLVIYIGCSREHYRGVFRDQFIKIATLDHIEGAEIRETRDSYTELGCAHCGSSLGLDECTKNLPETSTWRIGPQREPWDMVALPPKLVQLLEDSGHALKIEPSTINKD